MKRFIWPLLITLTLVACSRIGPEPTSSPSPTVPGTPTSVPLPTFTLQGSPVPRITIVPSATRLQPTPTENEPETASDSPTSTVEPPPTPIPSSTSTPRIIDAGATATATPPDSPLPTPTLPESPLPQPSGTASPSVTDTPSSRPSGASATPSPTTEGEASATATSTSTPESLEWGWGFENVYTYYDDEFQEFYVWGEVVNNTGSDQRLTTLMPLIYDADENPVTSDEDVDATDEDYKKLRKAVSLAPGRSLSFSFLVYLPDDVSVEDNYKILIEAEPAEPARDDLDVLQYNLDASDWPDYYYVEGSYENPGPDLTEYVAVVVTLYDEDERVIGLGWFLEEGNSYLTTGEHDFEVEVIMWEIMAELAPDVPTYEMEILGY